MCIIIMPAYSLREFGFVGVLVSVHEKVDIEEDIAILLVAVVEVLILGASVSSVVGIDPKKIITILI